MSATEARNNSTASTSSVKNAFKSAARLYKEHHEASQAAWEAFYGVYPTPATSRRPSEESTSSARSASAGPSTMSKAWTSIKKRAAEHHESVNGAVAALYGVPQTTKA